MTSELVLKIHKVTIGHSIAFIRKGKSFIANVKDEVITYCVYSTSILGEIKVKI